ACARALPTRQGLLAPHRPRSPAALFPPHGGQMQVDRMKARLPWRRLLPIGYGKRRRETPVGGNPVLSFPQGQNRALSELEIVQNEHAMLAPKAPSTRPAPSTR